MYELINTQGRSLGNFVNINTLLELAKEEYFYVEHNFLQKNGEIKIVSSIPKQIKEIQGEKSDYLLS